MLPDELSLILLCSSCLAKQLLIALVFELRVFVLLFLFFTQHHMSLLCHVVLRIMVAYGVLDFTDQVSHLRVNAEVIVGVFLLVCHSCSRLLLLGTVTHLK